MDLVVYFERVRQLVIGSTLCVVEVPVKSSYSAKADSAQNLSVLFFMSFRINAHLTVSLVTSACCVFRDSPSHSHSHREKGRRKRAKLTHTNTCSPRGSPSFRSNDASPAPICAENLLSPDHSMPLCGLLCLTLIIESSEKGSAFGLKLMTCCLQERCESRVGANPCVLLLTHVSPANDAKGTLPPLQTLVASLLNEVSLTISILFTQRA